MSTDNVVAEKIRAPDLRQALIAEIRSWCGTPFVPQACVKGRGIDCKGLIVGPALAVGLEEAGGLYAEMADYDLGRIDSALLKRGLAETLLPVAPEDALPGDVLLCRYDGAPAHLAWLTEAPTTVLGSPERIAGGKAVHAQIASTAHAKETALRVLFNFFPLDSVWRFRALAPAPSTPTGGRGCR